MRFNGVNVRSFLIKLIKKLYIFQLTTRPFQGYKSLFIGFVTGILFQYDYYNKYYITLHFRVVFKDISLVQRTMTIRIVSLVSHRLWSNVTIIILLLFSLQFYYWSVIK